MVNLVFSARCVLCGRGGADLCEQCHGELRPAAPGPGLALWAYEGAAKELVLALKHGRGPSIARAVAPELAMVLRPLLPDQVTWAPTSVTRRSHRGYDQSQLLARRVGALVPCPVRRLLERHRGPAQHGAGRAARLEGPRFVPVGRVARTVAVVDDVITTGASLQAAASCLGRAGATVCIPLALCRVE